MWCVGRGGLVVGGALVLVVGVAIVLAVGVVVLVMGMALVLVVGGAHVLVGLGDRSAFMMGRDIWCIATCNLASTRNWALTFGVF